ncbi:MAG: lipoate--protein ligase [Bacteroidales bacterium]|nr:lipoate--protein ligase [Bacteroidales bacterium]
MRCIVDKGHDPYFNLAAEEYLLKHCTEPIFRLWRNAPSVIIGKNQNAAAEINGQFIHQNNIPVVRRLSGGGAVFHDLGNINFTFIDKKVEGEDTSAMFARFTAPIIAALRKLGVEAYLEGRNDLLIDGKKFSGNAICVYRDRVLQHGTLMFSASISDLSGALNARPEKFVGKGVQSTRSRVTNISQHLPTPMEIGDFIQYIYSEVAKEEGASDYTPAELEKIQALYEEKYSTNEWNFGVSPKYTFSNSVKLPSGFIEVYLNVEKGIIQECRIHGDYFFTAPTSELEARLVGVLNRYDDIFAAVSDIDLNSYISGVTPEEFTELIQTSSRLLD